MATPRSQARRPRTRREGRGPGRPAHAPVAPSHARCVRHAAASGRPRAGARRRGRAYASVSRLSRRSAAYVARSLQSDRRGLTVRGDDFAVSPLAAAVPRTRGLPYGHHTVRMRTAARREPMVLTKRGTTTKRKPRLRRGRSVRGALAYLVTVVAMRRIPRTYLCRNHEVVQKAVPAGTTSICATLAVLSALALSTRVAAGDS